MGSRIPGCRRFAVLLLFAGLAGGWQVAVTAEMAAPNAAYLNPEGYRSAHYRAPTPLQVPHGQTLDTRGLQALLQRERPLLIDVQAVAVRPELAEFGLSWLPSEPRYSLPGATWLPNVGYAQLSPGMDGYFRSQLARLSGGDRSRPIVIFCVIDCWMSWNAVQRAYRYGYRNLYWYRDGTDLWAAKGMPLEVVQPVPLDNPGDASADTGRSD